MHVCREAGDQMNARVREAVQSLHDEASRATRRLQADGVVRALRKDGRWSGSVAG